MNSNTDRFLSVHLGQHEAKMKSLSETIKEHEVKKRALEEQVDSLNEEVSKAKSAEQMNLAATANQSQEDKKVQRALEEQIAQHREQHQKQVLFCLINILCCISDLNNVPLAPQVAALRNEIEEKQAVIAELKDETQKLSLAFEQLKGEHEKLKEEEQGKSKKLNVSTSLVVFLSLSMDGRSCSIP